MRDTIPKFTRQDFIFLADTLNELEFVADEGRRGGGTVHQYVVEVFAEKLRATNPNFKRDTFIERATR